MESRDGGATESRTHVRRLAARWPVLVVTLVMILSVSAPMAAGTSAQVPGDASVQSNGDVAAQQADAPTNGRWTDPPERLQQTQLNETLDEEKREAAEDGVDEAVETLQRQGVSVNQSQRAAAVNGTVAAVAQHQNASVEQIQNASTGAVSGAFLQSQNVSVEQVQNATFGGASGALSQHQNASATQLQHAAYGGTHGAVAQRQNASITQVQTVAQGAAAGAAHEAGKRDRDDSKEKAHPGAIREAAQGAAFGSLMQEQRVTVEQQQTVTVEQRQYAAAGAAEGALNQSQTVTVEQTQTATISGNQTASVKQIQVAAMGAAKGSLSITQRQNVTVRQVQSAARGACKGALTQVQDVSITQIQESSFGAAKGAISQSQSASVTQIQAAATGAAEGTLVQRQSVSITQVQHAAAGAAKGAASSAAQNQVVNVEQIQAAATGASQGSIVQIQQINVVQIQIISQGAADGALSQHQEASVTQIQSAARGASEGATSLTQRQEVNVEQTQIITRDAASDTASTAAQLNIDVDQTIYDYAKGASENPDEEDEEDDQLRSLFVSAEQDGIFLANPNDVAVTVTITSEDGDAETVTLSPGESTTVERDRGTHTLTAETSDGEDVEVDSRDELTVSVGDELQSLTANVENQSLVVENSNDERVTVDVSGDLDTSFDVPGNWEERQELGPGTYTATAEATDGESVQINGEDFFQFTVESEEQPIEEPETPNETETPDETDTPNETETPNETDVPQEPAEPVDLNVTVDGQNVSFDNPSETTVTVTATSDDGAEETVEVPGEENVTEEFDPGNYTLTGESDDEREVLVNGQDEFELTIESTEPINLSASIDDENLTVENPSDTDVTATVTPEDGAEQTFEVPAGENATESFDPGTYNLTGDADGDQEVQINGESAFEFTVEPEEAIDLNVTVDGQNVSFDNPSETAVTVTATDENDSEQTVDVPGGENVTAAFDPGTYTLTGESDDERDVLLDNQSELTVDVPEPSADLESLNVSVDGQNVTVDNPNDAPVTVSANATDAENRTIDVDSESNVTEQFDPGNYTLTAETDDGTTVPVNGQQQFEVNVSAPEPGAVDLNVTVDEQNVSVENPSDTGVTVTATDETNETQTFLVGADENVTEEFDPGNYTLAGESEDERDVLLDGEAELEIQVEEQPVDVESLNVSVDGQNVTVDNPNDTPVTVSANATDAENRTIDVDPESNVTEAFDPGNYTLTAETDDGTTVPVNESTEHEITVEAEEPTATGTLTVESQAGDGTEFVVANASATVPFVVEIDYEAGTAATEEFSPDETLDNATLALDPPIENDSDVTVTVRAAETDEALANETVQYDVAEPFANVTMADQTTDGETVVVQHANLTEGGFLAIHEDATNGTDDVLGTSAYLAPGEYENVTVDLDEPLTADASVIVTAHQDTDDNQAFDYAATDGAADGPYVDDAGLPVSDSVLLTLEDGAPDRELDSCTVIDEPGAYELTANVQNQSTNACLEITSSDVVLDGNGNAVQGSTTSDDTADTFGVELYDPEGDEIENVTVRNLATENWDVGVSVGNLSDDQPAQARLENLAASDNRIQGVRLVNADGTEAENVTANRNGNGILFWETQGLAFETINASENDNAGLQLSTDVVDSEFTDVTAIANGEDGVYTGELVGANTFTELVLADNGDAGIEFSESGDNVVRDSVIEANGQVGVRTTYPSTQTLENVTVSGHSGPEVRSGVPEVDQSTISATDLQLDPVASFAATQEPVTLDLVDSEALPPLPENATAIQDGVNASGIENSVDATITYDETQTDGEIELWRHDGTEWTSVETVDAAQAAGSYDTTLTEDGVYALVEVEEEAEPAAFEASELDPEEATVTQGDLVTVSATIENVGDEAGTQTVELQIDGTLLAEQQLQLESGQTASVTFEDIDTGTLAPGPHEHAIVTQDDEVNGTLTVEEATPTPEPEPTTEDTPTQSPDETETATPDEPSSPTPVGPPVGGTEETETTEPTPNSTVNGGNETA